jgi:hypothetical protein
VIRPEKAGVTDCNGCHNLWTSSPTRHPPPNQALHFQKNNSGAFLNLVCAIFTPQLLRDRPLYRTTIQDIECECDLAASTALETPSPLETSIQRRRHSCSLFLRLIPREGRKITPIRRYPYGRGIRRRLPTTSGQPPHPPPLPHPPPVPHPPPLPHPPPVTKVPPLPHPLVFAQPPVLTGGSGTSRGSWAVPHNATSTTGRASQAARKSSSRSN